MREACGRATLQRLVHVNVFLGDCIVVKRANDGEESSIARRRYNQVISHKDMGTLSRCDHCPLPVSWDSGFGVQTWRKLGIKIKAMGYNPRSSQYPSNGRAGRLWREKSIKSAIFSHVSECSQLLTCWQGVDLGSAGPGAHTRCMAPTLAS
eukprot:5253359-Amphidinium_carterae.1